MGDLTREVDFQDTRLLDYDSFCIFYLCFSSVVAHSISTQQAVDITTVLL